MWHHVCDRFSDRFENSYSNDTGHYHQREYENLAHEHEAGVAQHSCQKQAYVLDPSSDIQPALLRQELWCDQDKG